MMENVKQVEIDNLWRMLVNGSPSTRDLGANLLKSWVGRGAFPSTGDAVAWLLNQMAAKLEGPYRGQVKELLEKADVSMYPLSDKGDHHVSFIMGVHVQWKRYWAMWCNGVPDFPEVKYLQDHLVCPQITAIVGLVERFNTEMGAIVNSLVASIDHSNAHQVGSLLYLFNKLTKDSNVTIPRDYEVQKRIQDSGMLGTPPFKEGQYVEHDGEIYVVTKDSGLSRSYSSPHLYWHTPCKSIKRDGTANGHRGHSPYRLYEEGGVELKPTTLDQWEWSKRHGKFILKQLEIAGE